MGLVVVGILLVFGAGILAYLYVARNLPDRRRGLRSYLIASTIGLGVVILLKTALPNRAFAVLALVAVFALGGLIFWTVIILATRLIGRSAVLRSFRAQVRAQEREGYELLPFDGVPPPAVERKRAEMEGLGFEVTLVGQDFGGGPHVLLFRGSDSIIGEVVEYVTGPAAGTIVVELTSILDGRRAVLATSNYGLVLDIWPAELRQTFPGASARQLLLGHERALELLEAHGLRSQPLTSEEALEARSWGMSASNAAVLAAPRARVLQGLTRIARKEPVGLGALDDHPRIKERLKGLADQEANP